MCGIKSRLLGLLLGLSLLLLPVLSSADVVLTDQEYQEIMDSLIISDQELTEAKKEIEQSKMNLLRAQTLLTEQVTELAVLRINSDLQSKSFETLKRRVDIIWIDRVGFGLLGLFGGYGLTKIIP